MQCEQRTVAVIVPTHNRAELVPQTLDSILNQTRPAQDIVVVDDGSTDETASVVARYGEHVRYIAQANAGKSAALNHAMSTIRSDYAWIMDDDDVALPDALARHFTFLDAHPEIDFTYSGHYAFEGDQLPGAPRADREVDCRDLPQSEFFIQVMLSFPFLMQGMLVPTRCYRHVGAFDETLTFNEDYDMILRLSRAFRGARLPKATFHFRAHPRPRGPQYEQYSSELQREACYRKYNRQVFCGLRDSLPLGEYLAPPVDARTALTHGQRRQALLQRACVLARHAVFDKAFEDLTAVFESPNNYDAFTLMEQRIFSQMFSVETWWLRKHPEYATNVGLFLKKYSADTALNACARGLQWRLFREMRCKRFRNVMTISLNWQRLVGFARLPGTLGASLRHRYENGVAVGD